MSKLVIVESPTKAKTINKFLGKDFKVLSSFGHIRDLPKSDLGVDIEHDFAPKYVIPTNSRKHVKALKDAAKTADEVLFATDEDREGEAISWHLAQVLKIDPSKVKRIVFHEITKSAIEKALENPRPLNLHLVDAQQARRILDRLYGYEVSPILWRKVAPKLSAGRVQSVATRIIVLRERERMAFVRANYWDILGGFSKASTAFEAKLVELGGHPVANGKHFAPTTGELTEEAKKKQVQHLDEDACTNLVSGWKDSTWTVESITEKPLTSNPPAPFTTSTLQQAAARRLRLSSRETMRAAQSLYEHGFITYMRTDSTTLSTQALEAARSVISSQFGENYLPDSARQHKSKVKNAQEAHEAIRPSGETFQTPEAVAREMNPTEADVYKLIWQRTLASQMLPAKMRTTSVRLTNGEGVFRVSGKVIDFDGYLAAYPAQSKKDEAVLPDLEEGETITCASLEPVSHETKPPARYTEASLIKLLEHEGIGRPSTFASIISTIINRGYVRREGHTLIPTFKALAVIQLLEKHFTHLVDIDFTAEMEGKLDEISLGEHDMGPFLNGFWHGDKETGLETMLKADIDARSVNTIPLGEHEGTAVNLRVGKYGPYIEYGDQTANIPEDMAPDELNVDNAIEMVKEQAKGPEPLGTDPETGKAVYVIVGRYGPYVQLGEKEKDTVDPETGKKKKAKKPKMKSLLQGMQPEDVTLETALKLLALPKELGEHPKLGEPIMADLGRFGPYLKCGTETRSLKAEDSILDITLERAIELLNEPKRGRGRTKTVLKELGDDPKSKKTIQVLDGRYGPYVSDGKTNASLPKDVKPEDMTLEKAIEMIAAKKKK